MQKCQLELLIGHVTIRNTVNEDVITENYYGPMHLPHLLMKLPANYPIFAPPLDSQAAGADAKDIMLKQANKLKKIKAIIKI